MTLEDTPSRMDLVAALGSHLLMGPMWLFATVGLAMAIPKPDAPSAALVVGISLLFSALPVTWAALGVMLMLWWRQGRGPLWSYPFRWGLALSFTFLALIALCFPTVRK